MAKKHKSRLPKRVAGLKVPKILRKGKVGQILASPVGQAILLEQLMRVGDRLLDGGGAAAAPAASRLAKSAMKPLESAGAETSALSGRVGEAFNVAARAFVQALREPPSFASAEPTPPAESKREQTARRASPESPKAAH